MTKLAALLIGLTLSLAGPAQAAAIKIAVLKFGTVNWELDTVTRHGLDRAAGVEIEILPLAGKNATSVALQAGAADMIVTDWVWVSRQRAEGAGFTFVPYSTALGALMAPADSPIASLADLAGRRLGIAGGPVDKSWLLVRALAAKQAAPDLEQTATKVFGAPPLLNQQMLSGGIDAVINFWHYCARLEARGFKRVTGLDEVLQELGIAARIPMIGYVFDQAWAAAHEAEVAAFFAAVREARDLLRQSDQAWDKLRPLMRADDEASFLALRDGYRAGIPRRWGAAERQDAAKLFSILAELGGEKLVGRSSSLQEGTFWPGVTY